jgi:muramoyltetrapeptide carboxypeptidase LdcA involved in peptidoglycan recycling
MFFSYLKGDLRVEKSYQKYVSFINSINEETMYEPVRWLSKKQQKISGRLIGGCIEVIDKLIGTDFDYTNSFIELYRNDGIVWYFDIFNMSAYDFYITLLQIKNAGWFRHCKGVLVGRPAFPRVEDEKLNYEKALDKALGQIPHICEMDIGHTDPSMTLINGALIDVEYNDGKGKIRFRLK